MNENVYLIQFDYDGKTHNIPNLSYNNLKDDYATKLWMAGVIEDYIKENKIHQDGAKVSNANLIGKGCEVLIHVDDFAELYDNLNLKIMEKENLTEDEIVENYSVYHLGNNDFLLCIYKPKKDPNEQNNIEEDSVTWNDVFIAFILGDKDFILQPEGNSIISNTDNKELFLKLDIFSLNHGYEMFHIKKLKDIKKNCSLKKRLITIYNKRKNENDNY